jgi:putative endonuclease
MFSVYIIYSATLDRYYVGYSEDVQKRVLEHNSGLSGFTSKANDWQLKYTESFDSRHNAIKREVEIKNKKSRKFIEWLIENK